MLEMRREQGKAFHSPVTYGTELQDFSIVSLCILGRLFVVITGV